MEAVPPRPDHIAGFMSTDGKPPCGHRAWFLASRGGQIPLVLVGCSSRPTEGIKAGLELERLHTLSLLERRRTEESSVGEQHEDDRPAQRGLSEGEAWLQLGDECLW